MNPDTLIVIKEVATTEGSMTLFWWWLYLITSVGGFLAIGYGMVYLYSALLTEGSPIIRAPRTMSFLLNSAAILFFVIELLLFMIAFVSARAIWTAI